MQMSILSSFRLLPLIFSHPRSSTSPTSIAPLTKEEMSKTLERKRHPIRIAIIGCGLVGSALIAQLSEIYHENLQVILIASSKQFLSHPDFRGIDLPLWKRLLRDEGKNYSSFAEIRDVLLRANDTPLIVVDCTASDDIPSHYEELLDHHISIATPNKKGVSGTLDLWRGILLSAREYEATIYYEATVGAGLPIISTLQDLYESKDEVRKIEGIFSGTLSYIFNEFGRGTAKFSEVVKEAKEKGYTEPDPRDDLNGMDVARKLTVLGRTIGMDIEGPPSSKIFPIDSLIPSALVNVKSGDDFLAGLPAHDADFDQKRETAKKEGSVLRYVGSIDVATRTIKVGLETYPLSHSFASLQGSDNIIAFHTKRYANRPLIVQGAGAGADVTAMGVMADIFKFSERA